MIRLLGGALLSEFLPVSESVAMQRTLRLAQKMFLHASPLCLQGEPGVGKRTLARYVSQQTVAPEHFVRLACGTLSGIESDFFVPKKEPYCVVFESLEDLSWVLQARLAYFLHELEQCQLFQMASVSAPKIILTVNDDIKHLFARGVLRQDLYWILLSSVLNVLPLRQRREDILPLTKQILHAEFPWLSLTSAAARCLTVYDWAGNIRELAGCVRRTAFALESNVIDATDLLFEEHLPVVLTSSAASSAVSDVDIRSLEKQHILDTLVAVGGVKKLAAEKLGMSERTLRYKLQRYREDMSD